MSNLGEIAKRIDEITADLKASNDQAEYIESMRELRKSIRPYGDADLQPSPCDTGLIVGNFVKNFAARR